MTSPQETKRTLFHQAETVRKGLIRDAEMFGLSRIVVSSLVASILTRFPKDFLGGKGILILTREEETTIVVSRKASDVFEESLAWMREDKSEASQRKILAGVYDALYKICRASVTPGVRTAQVLEPCRDLIDQAIQKFPFLENLENILTFIGEGRRDPFDQDLQELAGAASIIFEELKLVKDHRVLEWEEKGWIPENMFTSPGDT
jgi:hypothetical protein